MTGTDAWAGAGTTGAADGPGAGSGAIRWLGTADVLACLPDPAELVRLAEVALRSLVAGADVPPKAAVGGPGGRFGHGMPGRLDAAAVPGGGATGDLLGMKWIAGGPANRAGGLPAMSALIVLSDPSTGLPLSVLDGGIITAWRTAALSAAGVRLVGAGATGGRWPQVVLLGAGAQGAAHAALLGHVLPGLDLVIHDRHPDRAAALAAAATLHPGVRSARAEADPAPALRSADVVVSATSLGGEPDLGPEAVGPDAIVVPVDYGARVTGALVGAAGTFLVDDREQLARNVRAGRLPGWPAPTGTLGERLLAPEPRAPGRAVVLHQGPAIADLLVADAVLRTAVAAGRGTLLAR